MLKHFAVVACLVGCGGGGVSFEKLPDEIEDAACGRAVACQNVVDRATCEAAFELDSGFFGSIEAAIEDGTIKYDADAAEACASSFGGNCDFAGLHEDDPCDDVFTGTVPAGGACVIDLQCANQGDCVVTDQSCDPEIACCQGTCMGSATESAIGGPCDDDLHFCGVDAYCKAGTTTGVCTALVRGEGSACDEIDACVNPMYCNLNFTTGTGTCKTPAASNAACVRADLLPCIDGRDHCDPTTLTCVRDVAVGATCGNGVQCIGYASCINGTCVADLPAGATCSDATGDCAGNLDCVNGTCQLPPPSLTCSLP